LKLGDIEDRIKKVDDKLWDFTIPRGSTKLYRYDFTEKERKIVDLFDEVMEKYDGQMPPADVLLRMNPLFDAMRQIWIQRAVDLFAGIVCPLLCHGRRGKALEVDVRLMEAQLWNFILDRARDYNEENAWTNAVTEVFGHTRFDELPDTEADPPDPGWTRVEEIVAKYCADRDVREAEEKKRFDEEWRQRRMIK
jgi:hypothetical protein